MLAHIDGDRTAALALFGRARELAALIEALSGPPDGEPGGREKP
jgi:hypothetical protein